MKDFVRLLLAFAPWILFLVLARGSVERLEIGLGVALATSVILGLLGIHRGIILWVGLSFFLFASILVIGFGNAWTMRYMGVLANGALAAGAWAGLLVGRPFTLDYARAHADAARQATPEFLRANRVLTAGWAGVFTCNAVLAYGKMTAFLLSPTGYELLSYALLIGMAALTSVCAARARRRAGHPPA